MSMDLTRMATVTCRNGIWYTSSSTNVSYPTDGHTSLAKVEDSSFWFKHRNDLILEVLKRFSFKGLMLDIGGGRGFVSRAIQEGGTNVVLVEPDEFAAQVAKSRGVDNVICGTFQDSEFQPEIADGLGFFDVIEHIPEPVEFLSSAAKLLKPGGLLFATVPAYQWLWSVEDEYAGHFRRYTHETLKNHLDEAGFEVEYLSPAFSYLVLPIWLLRSIPSKLGLRTQEPDDAAQEHVPSKLSAWVLGILSSFELKRVRSGRQLPLGSTLLVVARRR